MPELCVGTMTQKVQGQKSYRGCLALKIHGFPFCNFSHRVSRKCEILAQTQDIISFLLPRQEPRAGMTLVARRRAGCPGVVVSGTLAASLRPCHSLCRGGNRGSGLVSVCGPTGTGPGEFSLACLQGWLRS